MVYSARKARDVLRLNRAQLADAVWGLFTWAQTPEDHEFWHRLAEPLIGGNEAMHKLSRREFRRIRHIAAKRYVERADVL